MTVETPIDIEILAKLVQAGVPFNAIAMLAGMPAAPTNLPAHASDMVQAIIEITKDCPQYGVTGEALCKLRLWSEAVKRARTTSPEFTAWVAAHVLEMTGTPVEVAIKLDDIKHWVRASVSVELPWHLYEIFLPHLDEPPDPSQDLVKDLFRPSMSLETVINLSDGWHEAVAKQIQAEYAAFPRAWLAPFKNDNYNIVPITTCADLYREGPAMRRRGVFPRLNSVYDGKTYYYSVWQQQERIATLELMRKGDSIELSEIVGFCNPETDLEIKAAAESWLRKSRIRWLPPQKQQLNDEVPF